MEETEAVIKKIKEEYIDGYKAGFADGYKHAMREILENQKTIYFDELETPGIEGRRPPGH